MTTEVIITGTGTPMITVDRAGPGCLVRYGDINLQFDAGRNTAARLLAAGVTVGELTAVFLTHYHSDHVVGLQDIVLSHWVSDFADKHERLDVVAPNGPSTRYLERMLAPWDDDLEVRALHSPRSPDPKMDIVGFDVPDHPVEVWSKGDVRVLAGQVRHEPVIGAVGYRIETPDGTVTITGDTKVCPEVAALAGGSDIVVYEAMRIDFVQPGLRHIGSYHADTPEIGKQMEELGVARLMLTHLIPQPANEEDKQGFVDDLRGAGYTGEIIVCDDLSSMTLG
jgi:ribonuclease Z